MDKLSEIIASKRKEIRDNLRPVRERDFLKFGEQYGDSRIFREALRGNDTLSVIGEIKRKSPSAGTIAADANHVEQARLYINAEVDAISVLTDEKYFAGKMQDLWEVTDFIKEHQRPIPCLRKDFMVHPMQVLEACEAGARAILIIVRALEDAEIHSLQDAANLAGLDSIFEIHEEEELERAMAFDPEIIGVNNRDLTRFVTDLDISCNLIPKIPEGIITISESGIHSVEDAAKVKDAGAQAVLVGEALMRSDHPEGFIEELHALGEED